MAAAAGSLVDDAFSNMLTLSEASSLMFSWDIDASE